MPETATLSFNEDDLQKLVEHPSHIPQDGLTYSCWDTAFSTSEQADFSAGIAAKVSRVGDGDNSQNHIFLFDAEFGRFDSTMLPYHVVDFQRRSPAVTTWMEQIAAHAFIQKAIQEEAKKRNVAIDISWDPVGNQRGSKISRMLNLKRMCDSGRIHFMLDAVDELISQLVAFDFTSRNNHGRADDLADCTARLVGKFV